MSAADGVLVRDVENEAGRGRWVHGHGAAPSGRRRRHGAWDTPEKPILDRARRRAKPETTERVFADMVCVARTRGGGSLARGVVRHSEAAGYSSR